MRPGVFTVICRYARATACGVRLRIVNLIVGFDQREAIAYHVFCQSVIEKASLPVRKIGTAGQLTYSLYMLHPIVATLSMTAGKKILLLRGWELNIWVIVTSIALIPVSLLSYHVFEKPLRDRMSGTRPPRMPPRGPAAARAAITLSAWAWVMVPSDTSGASTSARWASRLPSGPSPSGPRSSSGNATGQRPNKPACSGGVYLNFRSDLAINLWKGGGPVS